MDELLSLFGADDGSQTAADEGAKAEDVAQKHGRSSTTSGSNDNFGDAFGDAFGAGTVTASTSSNSSSQRNNLHNAKQANYSNPTRTTTTTAAQQSSSQQCDPLTGIRIVNRRTSRADMADAFSCLTYKSASMLAAASRLEWSSYLADGGGGAGPPSGKTNLATCGILTSETSSRLSKTRRAFAIMTLGDLPSSMHSRGNANAGNVSASITVFLFGDALGILRSNKAYINPGWAVAILGPNLMPPRDGDKNNGGATSITLSVSDPRQILPIGKAADCDRCKGTIRIRSASDYGGTKWVDSRCSTLVDLRLGGGYCQTHRRQGLSSGGNGNGGKTKGSSVNNHGNLTFMQKQRMQSMPQQHQTMTMKGGISVRANALNGHMPSLREALSQSGLFEPTQASSSLPASKAQILRHAPLHMKKATASTSPNLNGSRSTAAGAKTTTKNPYLSKDKAGQMSQTKKRKETQDILGEALERKRSRMGNNAVSTSNKSSTKSNSMAKRPLKVFTTEGYDGSVLVPKPSALLFKAKTSVAAVAPSHEGGNRLSLESAQNLLEKQRSLAAMLKDKGGSIADASLSAASGKNRSALNKDILARSKQRILAKGCTKTVQRSTTTRPVQSSRHSNTDKSNDFASIFGDEGSTGKSFDRDAILNAKSRFSSAVNAEEYARARAVVQELECREATKEGKTKKDKNGKVVEKKATPGIVTSGWVCRTCKKKTPFKPSSCIRARHDVRQQREIKGGPKSLGSKKERMDKQGRDLGEDGLILGSGLDWSGWRGGLA